MERRPGRRSSRGRATASSSRCPSAGSRPGTARTASIAIRRSTAGRARSRTTRSGPCSTLSSAQWTAAAGGPAELEPFLSQAFEGASELRPAALETIFDDGFTRVQRPAAGSELGAALRGPDELAGVLSGALAPFGGSSAIEAAVQIVEI